MSTTPWGLSRLSPFAATTVIPPYTMELDAETQTGICRTPDGSVIDFGHRKSNKATEVPTSVPKGDGQSHKQYDSDTTQDTEED